MNYRLLLAGAALAAAAACSSHPTAHDPVPAAGAPRATNAPNPNPAPGDTTIVITNEAGGQLGSGNASDAGQPGNSRGPQSAPSGPAGPPHPGS